MLIHCEIQKWIILDTRIFNKDIFLEFHVLRYYTIHCLPPSFFYFDHCSFFRSSLLSLCSNSQKRLFFRFLSPMRHRPTNGAPLNVPLTFHAFFSEHTVLLTKQTTLDRPHGGFDEESAIGYGVAYNSVHFISAGFCLAHPPGNETRWRNKKTRSCCITNEDGHKTIFQ